LTGQIPLGIAEHEVGNYLTIAPNPFHDVTSIQASGDFSGGILSIYDVFGKAVNVQPVNAGEKITLSREKLPSGLYFIRLTAGSLLLDKKRVIISD
jgi:hypothetical protein